MKVFLELVLLVSAVLAFPFPEWESENELDEIPDFLDNKEWALVPDDDGKFHIVNVEEALKEEPTSKALGYNPEKDVQYLLFTRKNPTNGQVVIPGNAVTLKASNFNSGHQTRILIHGWQSSSKAKSQTLVRDAYLKRGDFNVFCVDWSVGAATTYLIARGRVAPTGAVVGNFIKFLTSSGGVKSNRISIIGHSLGAHIAGFAGKGNPFPNQLDSIVGLDPAKPGFSLDDKENRLASGDAHYVETIHTNTGHLGFTYPLGEVSFFPNWGSSQPGCKTNTCCHSRAYEYFAESINSNRHFFAVRCPGGFDQISTKTCPVKGAIRKMGGEPLTKNYYGVYYVPINSKEPFALGRV